jgi:hypothetical protein
MIQVMDEMYFLIEWLELVRKCSMPEAQLFLVLKHLIEEGLVDQLFFAPEHKEFIRVTPFEETKFKESAFLNTRKGLLWLHV